MSGPPILIILTPSPSSITSAPISGKPSSPNIGKSLIVSAKCSSIGNGGYVPSDNPKSFNALPFSEQSGINLEVK